MFTSIQEIDLSGTPVDEKCTCNNPNADYIPKQKAECRAFIGQLKRQFKERLEACPSLSLAVKGNPHDFGTYYTVVAKYRETGDEEKDAKCEDLAYYLQDNLPEKWDDEAATELGLLTIPTI